MGNHQSNDLLADRITRVRVSVDLADVTPEDIDAFLDAVGGVPLAEGQVRRILARVPRGAVAAARPRRDAAARRPGCRLDCEQLERRLTPSGLAGFPVGGDADLAFGRPPDCFGETAWLRV